jgi:hypothetical protein
LTAPRDVAEALEAVDAVPLPARYALRDGVRVEVAAPQSARRAIEHSLAAHGVPLRELAVVDRVESPIPLRRDINGA